MTVLTRPCIAVRQPIGTFYLLSLPASELIRRVRIQPRTVSSSEDQNVQRAENPARIREIAQYVRDPDATFPTAVIISANSKYAVVEDSAITFSPEPQQQPENFEIGELLDGQHRIRGLREAADLGTDVSEFEIPVVVMLDLDVAEKAYVFSIINSKQTPVSKSLIYDLFGLAKDRSPYSVCHEVARAMNTDPKGPFYRGIKMLGKRQDPREMLTQGSFVKYLLHLITSKPDEDVIALKSDAVLVERDRPFNAFFRNRKDELILKAMTNYFQAVKETFPEEWDVSSYVDENGRPLKGKTPVLRRTVGYEALMRALVTIWPKVQEDGTLEKMVFLGLVKKFKENVDGTDISTESFGSSSADAGKLAALMTKDMALQA
ncbi:hypothetical protein R75471_07312 [Paraburkholderia domus]|uniref:DGQHR domain-containing protein n=1 Tax=Paraburkholderia domus TaxID=2793075 RepID=UPI001B2364B4|nr:DGQHR domain-containing protein [Paraburkholderia domus]CAE6968909.1 hypothetical protein R75471_07312 [Paraburkholderia domus]